MSDPIIITGGSVEISFDDSVYKPNGTRKHYNANKKIKSVVIKDENGNVVTAVPTNGKCTITIDTE